MKNLSRLCFITALTLPMIALSNDRPQNTNHWGYSLGLGSLYAPSYLGDDEAQISALPNFRISYGDTFFASLGEGIGYKLALSDNWKIGPIIKYDFGRDETGSNPLTLDEDNTDLLGLGDIEGTPEAGLFIENSFFGITTKVEVRQGIGGHESVVGEASISYQGITRLGRQAIMYSLGPEVKYLSQEYAGRYFNVNAEQSIASGLNQYNIDQEALIMGVKANLIFPHSRHLASIIFANTAELDDTLAQSSLVTERGDKSQTTLGYFLNYTF
ncbi:MAG: MipA/OmpV family protein [Pseudomonadota bacterium]